MTNTWPASLPQCPMLNAFSEQRQTNNASFQPEVGTAKMRRRSTAVSTLTAVAYRMTGAQRLTFNLFYEDTLSDGTLPFEWLHPITKTNYSWIFDPKDTPKFDRLTPDTFRVTFNLFRLP